jgi:ankyrin repeat protein
MENPKINLTKDQLIIKKCLKSYLTGKKYYETDIDKSYEYFKQCIKILNDIKEKNISINNNFTDIIEETETECSKFLTLAIEKTIDKPLNKIVFPTSDNKELFEIIEIGNIQKLKEYNYGSINFNVYNEQGLTPLHYAIKFGDISFLKQSFKLGACIDQTNKFGHTLLEFACLEKDPNMINFLITYGVDMKKHLNFREGKKYFNTGNQIDISLIEKIIMEQNFFPNKTTQNVKHSDETLSFSSKEKDKIEYLGFLFNYIKETEPINIEYCDPINSTISKKKILFEELVKQLDKYLETIDKEKTKTYISIIKEELNYDLSFKLGCPINKIQIILYNLVPFIDYQYNLRLDWLISIEIKYIILKILKNKIKINISQLKQELRELLYISYIKPEIIPEGLIQLIVLQWIYKIKV